MNELKNEKQNVNPSRNLHFDQAPLLYVLIRDGYRESVLNWLDSTEILIRFWTNACAIGINVTLIESKIAGLFNYNWS